MNRTATEACRQAAADMRKRANAAIAEGWVRPDLIDTAEPDGFCIGVGRTEQAGPPEIRTPSVWIADVERLEFAEHIVSWDPQVALAAADMLDAAAADFRTYEDDGACPNCGEGCGGHDMLTIHLDCDEPVTTCTCPGGVSLRVALAYLGEES